MNEPAPPVDLRPDHRAIVCDVLHRHIPDRKVLAFGSRATWTAKEYSDLDLAILGYEPLPLGAISALADSFGESDLPFKVDLVEWTSVDEAFRDIIRRDGVEVHAPGAVSVSVKHLEHPVNVKWRKATIEEVSEKVAMGPFGSSIKVETYVPEGIPIVSGRHLHGTRLDDSPGHNFISEDHATRLEKANVQRGDIIFTHRGTIGQVAYIPKTSEFECYVISQSQFFVRCKKSSVIPEFITAYFKSFEGQHKLLANASQVGVPSIAQPVTYLRTIEIPLPPLAEQRAIAHILGTLDDKIELNRRTNETLEAMAQAIFKDWFINFGPVRAKMEDRDTGLPRNITELFPNSFVDSELGKVPEGWTYRLLDELISVNPSRRLPKGKRAPYLDMANMPTKGHSPDTISVRPFGSGMRFVNGDTLVARITPCLENGKTAYIDFLQEGEIGWGSTEYIVLRPKPPLPSEFAYYLARSANFREFAIRNMSGTSGRQRVHARDVQQFPLVHPTKEVTAAFGELVKPLIAQANFYSQQNRTLSEIRDGLIPKLVSGQVRLGGAKEAVEAVP